MKRRWQPDEGREEVVRRLEAVDVVRLEIRPRALEAMRDFYGRLLGLEALEPEDEALR
ncbi:unnamed protein product, partial [marine sediment metagenome]